MGTPSSYLPLYDLPSSSFPTLEEVYCEIHDRNDFGVEDTVKIMLDFSPSVDVLLEAANLRCVKLKEFCSVSFLALLELPVEQLTSLQLGECDVTGIGVNLLGLEELTLQRIGQDSQDLFRDVAGLQQRSASTMSSLRLRCSTLTETAKSSPRA
ncbi:hypothetical protein BT96DRAFT_993697 [Gymnopus androsaceus JB14]|uniref:RNI-like protein n=1 Tax=Gymnopus androsaceus JB14 TaxID=1447944 RepID=A0A6A4HQ07_9AGAR|nr:hypothetical protein BT96DRAFT_993697 [Gymnopus androsaceus JB14]